MGHLANRYSYCNFLIMPSIKLFGNNMMWFFCVNKDTPLHFHDCFLRSGNFGFGPANVLKSKVFGRPNVQQEENLILKTDRGSVMIYDSLQAEFMETKYNNRVHRSGTIVFIVSVVNISESINNNNQIFWRMKNINRFDMLSINFASKAGLF